MKWKNISINRANTVLTQKIIRVANMKDTDIMTRNMIMAPTSLANTIIVTELMTTERTMNIVGMTTGTLMEIMNTIKDTSMPDTSI